MEAQILAAISNPINWVVGGVALVVFFRLVGREPYEDFEYELRSDLKPKDTHGTSFRSAATVAAMLLFVGAATVAVVLRSVAIGGLAVAFLVLMVALLLGDNEREQTAAKYGLKVSYPFGRHAAAGCVTFVVVASTAIAF